MELKKYISEFNNVLPPEIIGSLIKYLNTREFKETSIIRPGGEIVDRTIRSAESYGIMECKNYTDTHWNNLLTWVIKKHWRIYSDSSYKYPS